LKEFSTCLSKIITERLFIVLIVCLGLISDTKGQTLERQLSGHAWQQRPVANIIWNFQANGEFMAMYVLVGKESKNITFTGFILKKGTFIVNYS